MDHEAPCSWWRRLVSRDGSIAKKARHRAVQQRPDCGRLQLESLENRCLMSRAAALPVSVSPWPPNTTQSAVLNSDGDGSGSDAIRVTGEVDWFRFSTTGI